MDWNGRQLGTGLFIASACVLGNALRSSFNDQESLRENLANTMTQVALFAPPALAALKLVRADMLYAVKKGRPNA